MSRALVPQEKEAHDPASLGQTLQTLYSIAPKDAESALNDAFSKVKVSEFPGLPLGRVVEIPSNVSVADAMLTLSKHNILSAPIRDVAAPKDASWTDSYLGMVDFAGIVLWVLDQAQLAADVIVAGAAGAGGLVAGAVGALGAAALGSTGIGAAVGVLAGAAAAAGAAGFAVSEKAKEEIEKGEMDDEFYKAIKETAVFEETKVSEIKGTFRWSPFLPTQPSDSLLTLLLLVSKYRMKSVPIIEPGEGRIRNLVTQSSVIRFLSDCSALPWFQGIGEKSLLQAQLPVMPPEKVVFVTKNDKILTAFQKMKEFGFGGVPVLESVNGPVVGNVSARDVRFLLHGGHFGKRKDMTTEEFMHSASAIPPEVSTTHTEPTTPVMTPPITCTPSSTIADVISLLATTHIHRVYVVDDEKKLLGVITLRDLISKFVTEPKGYFEGFFDKVVPGPSNSTSLG